MPSLGKTFQKLADKFIPKFGDNLTATLRRYEEESDRSWQGNNRNPVETVTGVKIVVTSDNSLERDGWVSGSKTILLTGSSFASTSLDSGWTIQFHDVSGEPTGIEVPVQGPIEKVQPGADVAYYSCVVAGGAHGG